MANTALIKEKSRIPDEIRKAINILTVSVITSGIFRDDYFDQFRANIHKTIRDISAKTSELSSSELESDYGVKYSTSPSELDDFLNSEIEGGTLDDRIDKYTDQIKAELEAFVLAGSIALISKSDAIGGFLSSITAPFSSGIITDAMKSGSFLSNQLQNIKPSFGKGTYASAFNNLTRLGYDMSQRAYVENMIGGFASTGQVDGVIPYRNSKYPCMVCDETAGRLYTLANNPIPNHSRCLCGITPVRTNGNLFTGSVF